MIILRKRTYDGFSKGTFWRNPGRNVGEIPKTTGTGFLPKLSCKNLRIKSSMSCCTSAKTREETIGVPDKTPEKKSWERTPGKIPGRIPEVIQGNMYFFFIRMESSK